MFLSKYVFMTLFDKQKFGEARVIKMSLLKHFLLCKFSFFFFLLFVLGKNYMNQVS